MLRRILILCWSEQVIPLLKFTNFQEAFLLLKEKDYCNNYCVFGGKNAIVCEIVTRKTVFRLK